MRDAALAWYSTLNSVFVWLSGVLGGLTADTSGSVLIVVLLGVLGAASPCQLSTNASSIAYITRSAARSGHIVAWSAAAYVAGKALIYSAAGLLAILMGQGLQAVAVPTVVMTRKILGPLMILIGLAMVGVWRPRIGFGQRLSVRLRERAGAAGAAGGFFLGAAFAFAFCPTLALLFFGYVIPATVTGTAGFLYPAAFAVGTALPLIVTTAVLAASADTAPFARRLTSWEPRLRYIAGAIFLLAGLNDTVLYLLL